MSRALLAALSLALLSSPASAWHQAVTDTGLPLHWDQSCVWYTLSVAGSDDIESEASLHDSVRLGFEAWNVDCSALRFEDGGISDCTSAGYGSGRRRANLVVWREDEWPYTPEHGDPFSVTKVYYDPETGSILEADVEMNGVDFTWNTEGLDGEADVWNTMAHEAGHILGLDHSELVMATMYMYSSPGDTDKRDLHGDDMAGVCSIYPADADAGPCPGPPGADALCAGPSGGCGCAVLAARAPSPALCIGLSAILAALLSLARRRQRRSARKTRRHGSPPHRPRSEAGLIGLGKIVSPLDTAASAPDVSERAPRRCDALHPRGSGSTPISSCLASS